ncbi:hypothetical protein [Clostridium paraputrificum]|uniref:hypothetical protein n=1 Tax=Clostridium paraputrificum TaxID=29363 RepID=UPI0018AAA337|nr:hypothetical protein [Clostridium paraputrificum]MDB2100567.1 hypothetical protein [Clostridium paraputrificum]
MKELTPGEILRQLTIKNYELTKLNMELSKAGNEKDTYEKEYKKALAIKLLELRAERVPTAIIQDIAKGDTKINELRYLRDNARSKFSITLSAIANKRIEIETLRSKLTWQRVELSQRD